MRALPAKPCRRVLVTGASGRIGRFLVPALIDASYEVSALDIVAPQQPDPRARNLVADMTNREEFRRLLVGHDAVIHLAANPLAQEWSEVEPANITGAVSVLETAGELGLDKLIFASSLHVCGYATLGDHFHANSDRLYRIMENQKYSDGRIYTFAATPGPMAPFIKEKFPEIEKASRYTWDVNYLFQIDDKSFFESGKFVDQRKISSALPIPNARPSMFTVEKSLFRKMFRRAMRR